MKKILLLVVLYLGFTSYTNAQYIFLKILDPSGAQINGESPVIGHTNEIEGLQFGQENTNCAILGGGAGPCKPTAGQFTFNIQISKALTSLQKALFLGSLLRSIDVSFVKNNGGGQPFTYYQIRLEDVLISSISQTGDNSAPPSIQISFNATRIGYTYTAQKANGTPDIPVKFGWDVSKNLTWTGF